MFETAEIDHKLSKRDFAAAVPELRHQLIEAQRELKRADFPVLLVVSGVEGAGKGDTVNLLNEWMDARYVKTNAYGPPSDDEQQRPPYWRYWMSVPPRGTTGIFFSSWYASPITAAATGNISLAELDRALAHIRSFEEALLHDGALIIKLWFHLSKRQQRQRFKKLEKNPETRWRVSKQDWALAKAYDDYLPVWERTLRKTSTGELPWTVISGANPRYRNLTTGRHVAQRITAHLARWRARVATAPMPSPTEAAGEAAVADNAAATANAESAAAAACTDTTSANPADDANSAADSADNSAADIADKPAAPTAAAAALLPSAPLIAKPVTILSDFDLSPALDRDQYEEQLSRWQGQLSRLSRRAQKQRLSAIAVFEGWDAAGKGGCIRRMTKALDARYYQIIPIAAPTDEERARHYLWRFWRHLPRAGALTVYDRSWYGRVLVERVEGFAAVPAWMRAYHEICNFEEMLVEHGIVLCKFWLHISPDEQLRRFKEREATPWKRHKITAEDYRNRAKWGAYESAAHDMIERTSTEFAPWTLVAAENKRYARIKVLETVCVQLARGLR